MQALYRNHMGDDLEVVQDARVSFDRTTEALMYEEHAIPAEKCSGHPYGVMVDIPVLSDQDKNLIGFLARGCRSGQWEEAVSLLSEASQCPRELNRILTWAKRLPPHWTPFGQQTIKLRMKAPVPIRTQSFKHKIGFVENEESRRYIKSTPELFIPEFRSAPEGDIKQGSGGIHPHNEEWQKGYTDMCMSAIYMYEEMIQDGIAPEQARFVLPQGVYVNWVWTGSLFAYAEFFNKRSDAHAQGEIRDLAHAVAEVVEPLFPVSWKALTQ